MRARRTYWCKEVAQGRSYSCAEICEPWLLLDGALAHGPALASPSGATGGLNASHIAKWVPYPKQRAPPSGIDCSTQHAREVCAYRPTVVSCGYSSAGVLSGSTYWPLFKTGRILSQMAATSKPPRARVRDDVPQQTGALSRALDVREHLLEEARTLRAAGKIREARGVEKRAAQVEQLVGALEADYGRSEKTNTAH